MILRGPARRGDRRRAAGAAGEAIAVLAAIAMAAIPSALGACSEARDAGATAPVCPTWQGEVAARLATCTGCHGGATPAAGYELTSYLGALGGGSDEVANAIAGDAGSRLLTRLDGATDAAHQLPAPAPTSPATLPTLRRWVVECELAALTTPVHERGVLDPASAGFHGVTVAAVGWDLGRCAECHGEDFSGGSSGASCNGCHADGPTACETCHALDEARAPRGAQGGARPYGVGPLGGAHRGHAAAGLACAECHQVPAAWDSEAHVRTAGRIDPAPAELTFGATARLGGASPSYDGVRCADSYCHGATLTAGGGAMREPSWDGGPAQGRCGSCHGAPPPSHADDDRCVACHPAAAARHVDGVVTVGLTAGCSGCHGDATSPAPPRDLSGATASSAPGVGAHRAHLEATRRLSAPIACAQCHLVPTELRSPGHLDSAGPAEVEASLGWNRDAGTCASAWCHGPARPPWTSSGEVSCGSCHGVPPADGAHAPGLPLTACVTCHPRTVDAFGNILVTTGPGGLTSEHLDGNVDLP